MTVIQTKPGNVLDSIDERHFTCRHSHGNKSVCSKMGAKHPHAVQKELTSFFGLSQSESKKTKGQFKIVLCLGIEIAFFNSLSIGTNFYHTES